MRKFLAAFLLINLSFAHADTCGPPLSEAIVSNNGNIAVRIDFGRSSGSDSKRVECAATVTRWSKEERSYSFLRRIVLRNPEGPGTAVITNDARFLVTFDDVCQAGLTANAVVIYDLERGTTFAHRLDEFLPESYRENTLLRSISNISWRGDPFVMESDQTVYVAPPPYTEKSGRGVVIDPAKNTISFEHGEK